LQLKKVGVIFVQSKYFVMKLQPIFIFTCLLAGISFTSFAQKKFQGTLVTKFRDTINDVFKFKID
jgi:hypothetical protein